MAIAHVQQQTGTAGGLSPVGSIAVTFGSAVGSSGIVIGVVAWDQSASATISSIQDDKSNNYTVYDFTTDAGNGQGGSSFVLGNITNGPITVTVTFSVASGQVVVVMDEYSGGIALADPRDGHTSNTQLGGGPGTGANAIVTTNITTTADGDMIWGAAFQTSILTGTINQGTGFNLRGRITADPNYIAMTAEDLIQSTHGAVQATFTQTGASNAVSFVTALKAAPPGIPLPPPTFTEPEIYQMRRSALVY